MTTVKYTNPRISYWHVYWCFLTLVATDAKRRELVFQSALERRRTPSRSRVRFWLGGPSLPASLTVNEHHMNSFARTITCAALVAHADNTINGLSGESDLQVTFAVCAATRII
jgi:hypothetical protein